ncbi:MAG: DUF697 domain-containing protein [Deltaproteobacteria bacterium]|jgi:uncharacterized protein (DUF697 family)
MSWLDTFAEIRERDWSKASDEERSVKGGEVVAIAAYASAASQAVPVPLVDLALLLPIHTTMVMTVGKIFGRDLSATEAKRVAVELGAIGGLTLAGHVAISALKNLLPPAKWVLTAASAASSFAITWGFGQLTIAYFERPELSREDLSKIFKDAMAEGSKVFSKEAFDRFREEQDEQVEDPAEAVETRSGDSDQEAPAAKKADPSKPSEPADPSTRESMRPKKRSM